MINIKLKDTGITLTCENSQELHSLYSELGHRYTFIINGVELSRMGPISDQTNAYFGGYTQSYFEKEFC